MNSLRAFRNAWLFLVLNLGVAAMQCTEDSGNICTNIQEGGARRELMETNIQRGGVDDSVLLLATTVNIHKQQVADKPQEHQVYKYQIRDSKDSKPHLQRPDFSVRAFFAEFIGMTLFIWMGGGAAMSIAKKEGSAWVLQVSLAFGFAITVLAYTIGHYSGCQLNCAVSLSLLVSARIGPGQFFCNVAAQLLGATLGASILEFMYGPERDCTGGLACNGLAEGCSKKSALAGEIMGTFLLVYVVHETVFNTDRPPSLPIGTLAPLAIGFSVFLAHLVLIPMDGCSINPTRSFGTAVVSSLTRKGSTPWKDHWIFWVGPIIGALLGSLVYCWMRPAY